MKFIFQYFHPICKIGYLYISLWLITFSCNPPAQEQSTDTNETQATNELMNPQLNFRPNILCLVAEDLSPVIPSFGDSTIVTPTLDKLAASGVCYDNFFSPHPVCAPARAAIITGMYANHIAASHMRTGPWFADNIPQKVLDRLRPSWPEGIPFYEAIPPIEVKMFTEYLRSAGYYCTNNAKQDYQFKKTMTAWDQCDKKAHWRNRKPGQPFYSVFNFEVCHESQIWQKAEDSLWLSESTPVPVPPYLPDNEIGQRDIRRMYSNILEMDAQVGEILQQLEEDGLLDSTIVVWYTDHGGPLPRQKRLLYDSGIKVPMIIRFPQAAFAGQRDDRIVSFIDLAPTMLSLAGIEPKKYMEGKAFLGDFVHKDEIQYAFGAADRFDGKMDRIRSVRDKQFKYIRYYMPEKPMLLNVAYRNQMPIMQELHRLNDEGQLTEAQALWFREQKPQEELFDILNDPHEINNLADDPTYAEKLQELRQACDNWVNAHDDTGMLEEKDLITRLWPNQTQPITANPYFVQDEGKVGITCETEGASIGYKLIGPEDKAEEMPWTVYQEPISIPENYQLIAIAHRIGFLRSEEIMNQVQ